MKTLVEQWQEKGLKKGSEKASQRFAKRLLARGNMSIEEISELTELSVDTLRRLEQADGDIEVVETAA